MKLSRRDFLRASGLAAGGLLLPPPPPDEAPRRVDQLGRAVRGLYIYERPSFASRQLNFVGADSVFNIYGLAESEDDLPNRVWLRVRRGYVHSATVQFVRWQVETPSLDAPTDGFLGEVIVPVAQSKVGPGAQYRSSYRYYYGTTHWIMKTATDDDGTIWYGIFGDRTKVFSWARGDQIHRVTPKELAPLSPEITNKRIEVYLETQTLRCYENERVALETKCSTGIPLRRENGQVIYGTPRGEWQVISKRPSRHMAGDDLAAADFFDLPGVPWVTYVHWWGVAIHGTYWHTDFGTPRSHGCINVPTEIAKWVYRWTTPVIPFGAQTLEAKGTPVEVL
jgi:hypothetical protein